MSVVICVYSQLTPASTTNNKGKSKERSLKNVCFHANEASERGTEIALYDYADYLEILYGITSTMLFPNISSITDGPSFQRFQKRFPISFYEVERHIGGRNLLVKAAEVNCDFIYMLKAGKKKSNPSYESTIKHHAVFNYDAHGTTYDGISSAVTYGKPERPVVPHIVRPVNMTEFNARKGLREVLHIPETALVMCRYGGKETFDVTFVHQWIDTLLIQQILHNMIMKSEIRE